MCGIIGYNGNRDIESVLVVGLERLSYRGYDSSGIAVIDNNQELCIWKKSGKIEELKKVLEALVVRGNIGIGHTRWATHGSPSDANSHPHHSQKTGTAIVHNGIIENYYQLKEMLMKKNYVFSSETDSECIVHLIDSFLKKEKNLADAVRRCLPLLKGNFAIAAISEKDPETMVSVRRGSPLLVGVGDDEQLIASDINAILPYTRKYFHLEDDEFVVLNKKKINVYDSTGKEIKKKIQKYKNFNPEIGTKGTYPHFMLKEIHEQPAVAQNILDTYLQDGKIIFPKISKNLLAKSERFFIQACGTSRYAGMIAKHWIESKAHIPTEVDISSEFRYRGPLIKKSDIVIALSQSGETADTLACIREARSKFLKILSFINIEGSSIDKESNAAVYTLAGTEIGVASTKNYIAQLMTLYLFSLYLAGLQKKKIAIADSVEILKKIPLFIQKILEKEEQIKAIAQRYATSKGFIFIGRHYNYATALEGALKLKEISYIHASGYAAGELKHGPIAFIDENIPTVCIATQSNTYEKMLSNMQEVKSRKGRLIAIASENDEIIKTIADEVIYIPNICEELSPILCVVPLQLLAYHIAVLLKCDVDQPKNLAKSVTVE